MEVRATPQDARAATSQKWPNRIWVVRHGQSAGNVARDEAEAAGRPLIDIATRDVDTPLSTLGERQSHALGEWFAERGLRPEAVLCSPYRRARQTAQLMLRAAGLEEDEVGFTVDERLREKEFGILDRLTVHGIAAHHPALHEQRRHVGKFYFRPPGGESWCDVILRLRSLLDTLTREHRSAQVLIVAHQVIVYCLRYLLERLDEAQVLQLSRESDVPNCGVTSYVFDPTRGRNGKLVPELVNFVLPLQEAGEPVTREPDAPAAPKP